MVENRYLPTHVEKMVENKVTIVRNKRIITEHRKDAINY